MKLGIYSMRDSVAGQYNTPTFEQSDFIAQRSFRYAINKNDFLGFNCKDVDLFKLGEFDTETGIITPIDPVKLVDGVACLENKK